MPLFLRPTKVSKTDKEGSKLLRDLEQNFLVEADKDVPVDAPFCNLELGCFFASECTWLTLFGCDFPPDLSMASPV